MKQSALLFLAILFSSSTLQVFAQTGTDAPRVQYTLKQQHPLNVRKHYKMTQDATVRRWFQDSSYIDYQRVIDYYITTQVIAQSDGFSTVKILVDSMQYTFANLSDSMITTYNSQTDPLPGDFDDLTFATIPNSRIWQFTYSSYGDIVRTESEDMDWVREYIKPMKKEMTPMAYTMWEWGISEENMRWLGDIDRNILPERVVAQNATWERDMHLRASNMDFIGKGVFHVEEFADSLFTITGKSDSLSFKQSPIETFLPMNKDLSQLVSAKGSANYTLEMQRFGTVQFVEVNALIHAYIRDVASSYTEDIQLRNTIELLGMFRW